MQENAYILLTPGPLSTSVAVKEKMLKDWCTWDDEYNKGIVMPIREKLVAMAASSPEDYTAVLMQGSGTYGVESVIGSAIPENGKLLVYSNGAYGKRIAQIASYLKISFELVDINERKPLSADELDKKLSSQGDFTHVAFVHCETTTGVLNPLADLCAVIKKHQKVIICDAMSSFGGIPIDMTALGIDFLISSANKCIQGVPGFSFVIARKDQLNKCKGMARSLSLDLYDQWETMEKGNGKWRFTSPTHVVRAFTEALEELEEEGGIAKRYERFSQNQQTLVTGMEKCGYKCLIERSQQSPIITSFLYPDPSFDFKKFYDYLKAGGFVIYPGKISDADTFRIGTIGHVFPGDIERLVKLIGTYKP